MKAMKHGRTNGRHIVKANSPLRNQTVNWAFIPKASTEGKTVTARLNDKANIKKG